MNNLNNTQIVRQIPDMIVVANTSDDIHRLIKLINDNNIDVNKTTSAMGYTLSEIALYSNTAIFKEFVLNHGTDINKPTTDLYETPISFALSSNNYELFEFCIERGVKLNDINAQNTKFYTYSNQFIQRKPNASRELKEYTQHLIFKHILSPYSDVKKINIKILEEFLKQGMDINIKDNSIYFDEDLNSWMKLPVKNWSILQWAIEKQDFEAIHYLLINKAKYTNHIAEDIKNLDLYKKNIKESYVYNIRKLLLSIGKFKKHNNLQHNINIKKCFQKKIIDKLDNLDNEELDELKKIIKFLEKYMLPVIQRDINEYINHLLIDSYKLNSTNLSNNHLNLILIFKIDRFLMKPSYIGGYCRKNKKYSKKKEYL